MELSAVIPIFLGFDPREAAVYHVMEQSIFNTATVPVSIAPLHSPMLENFDGQQDGTNAFIYSRFLVPLLMRYEGWAIYADSDMLFRKDIKHLWNLRDDSKAVMVVKHHYQTSASRKFVGTPIESRNDDYPRKNWSSLILWNCGHPQNKILTKEFVSESGGRILHRFSWLTDELVGDLPVEWNYLVGEYDPSETVSNAHFTLGAPGFKHYAKCQYSQEWNRNLLKANEMIGTDPVKMMRRAKDDV